MSSTSLAGAPAFAVAGRAHGTPHSARSPLPDRDFADRRATLWAPSHLPAADA